MENKYYTPNISEFFVGFEYEQKLFHIWQIKSQVSKSTKLQIMEKAINDNLIRVKYLDEEDIESLGFKHLSEEQYYNDKKDLLLEVKNEYIRISGETNTPRFLFFHGKIKNKAELKKLLTQLNIGFN